MKLKRLGTMILVCSFLASSVNVGAFAMEEQTIQGEMQAENGNTGEILPQVSENDATENVYETDGYKVTFSLQNMWESGHTATVKIENTGNTVIKNWALLFRYESGIENVWNAIIAESGENSYLIKNTNGIKNIQPGESVEFGLQSQMPFNKFPEKYELMGESKEAEDTAYTICYQLNTDYGSGFSSEIFITNNLDTEFEDWVLEFDFEREITQIWNASIEKHEGTHYVIKNAGYNADIAGLTTISFGFMGKDGSEEDVPENFILTKFVAYEGDSFELDTDGDGISDGMEKIFGTDYKNPDTDGDGLTDYQEIYLTMTDPLKTDTDGNGISDAQEDLDSDGLNNKAEFDYGTDPTCADTDRDNLTDYEEIYVYGTNPLIKDTDGDGLEDYDDIILGFSPLLQDTDGNGIWDSEEKLSQNFQKNFSDTEGHGVTKVEVAMDITGNIQNKVGIINVYEMDSLSRNVMGLVGVPVEIRCTETFDKATIKFTYDESVLENIEEENLAVLWYDEENNWYQILDQESVVDTENNTVSYTTTHFSTYMLVDSQAWYNAWRENIDYRNSGEGEENAHYFDIAFVVDVSGSMMGNNIRNAKTALNSFLDSLQDNDEAALISFNQKAFLLNDFTSSRVEVSKNITSLQADGGTNVNSGLVKALDIFEERENDRTKIVVLLCDGDVNYNQRTIDRYKEAGIQIYAVNVESNSAHRDLQKMAEQTNGQYFYGDGNELGKIFGQIQDSTVGRIDPTDEDGDGLYDIYETAGIKLPNGKIIKTDPTMPDTDGDGLTDLEETGIIYNVDDRYIGNNTTKRVQYFILHSNPVEKDSDGDGIEDKEDAAPWIADYLEGHLENAYFNTSNFEAKKYVRVQKYDSVDCLNGGNQNWWQMKFNLEEKKGMEDFKSIMEIPEYRMWHLGCGVVAMTDMELFLTQQNEGYKAPLQDIAYDKETGIISNDDYMKYAEYNRDNIYYLGGNYVNKLIGVLPGSMEAGLAYYLRTNNYPYTNVKWAPYSEMFRYAKNQTALTIEDMIDRNIPVVFSYHTFDKNEYLHLYQNIVSAKAMNEEDYKMVESHYMTIVGYQKYIDDTSMDYHYILKVVSWGDVYYVNYDEYMQKLSYVTNILSVGG